MPDARELLTVGHAAKRLPGITEAGLRCRIDRREVEVTRIAGRTARRLRRPLPPPDREVTRPRGSWTSSPHFSRSRSLAFTRGTESPSA